MSAAEWSGARHGCGSEAAAYALGSLPAIDAQAFERHLASCAVCRDEVLAFRGVVDALPMTTPQYGLPRELRRRVLNDLRAEPRVGHAGTRPRRGRAPRLAPALAILAFAVLASIVGVRLVPSSSGSTRIIRASVIGPSGSAELRVTGPRAELVVEHMQPPPAGRIYEVWLQRGRRAPAPTSALFSVTANGTGDVDVPGNLHGVSEVMVTQEPAGGSRVPTHPPVIVAQLT